MTRDTRIALFLMGELVAALRANDPDGLQVLEDWSGAKPREEASGEVTTAGLT